MICYMVYLPSIRAQTLRHKSSTPPKVCLTVPGSLLLAAGSRALPRLKNAKTAVHVLSNIRSASGGRLDMQSPPPYADTCPSGGKTSDASGGVDLCNHAIVGFWVVSLCLCYVVFSFLISLISKKWCFTIWYTICVFGLSNFDVHLSIRFSIIQCSMFFAISCSMSLATSGPPAAAD